mmetsp:Transcript_59932/g.111067  ORF Transcript_59932/g.111067 Transcript_59932/m.111067 type:complete len:259 (-) Transcript_59932:170-946(-)
MGVEREDFVESQGISLDALRCAICTDVFDDPVFCASQPCQHTFCRSCIEKALTRRRRCPLCSCHIEPHWLRPHLAVRNFLDDMQVQCPDRCGWVGKLESRNAHKQKCQARALDAREAFLDSKAQALQEKEQALKDRESLIKHTEQALCSKERALREKEVMLCHQEQSLRGKEQHVLDLAQPLDKEPRARLIEVLALALAEQHCKEPKASSEDSKLALTRASTHGRQRGGCAGSCVRKLPFWNYFNALSRVRRMQIRRS